LTSQVRSEAEKQILLLIGVDAIFGFAIGFSSPSFAPLVFALGLSMSFVGQAQTVSGMGATFLRLPVGVLMDRLGRRPFIILGGLITLVGYLAYSLATFAVLLGAGIVLVGIDFAIRGTASSAALGDAEKSGRLGRVFSLDLGATESAATIAPLIGGYAGTAFSVPLRLMFAASAAMVAIALVVLIIGYRPRPVKESLSSETESPRQFALPDRRIIPLLIIVALDAAAWRLVFPFWTLYIYDVMKATQEQLGITLAIAAGIPALTGLTLGSKLDKVGRRPFLAVSEWSSIGAMLPLLFGPTPEFAYVSAVFSGLVYSLWVPAINAYVVDHFGRERFGQTIGTMSLVGGLASAASPALGGWLWDNVSPQAPFTITLFLATAVGTVIWFKLPEHVASDSLRPEKE